MNESEVRAPVVDRVANTLSSTFGQTTSAETTNR